MTLVPLDFCRSKTFICKFRAGENVANFMMQDSPVFDSQDNRARRKSCQIRLWVALIYINDP